MNAKQVAAFIDNRTYLRRTFIVTAAIPSLVFLIILRFLEVIIEETRDMWHLVKASW